jgi:hypothetical protein
MIYSGEHPNPKGELMDHIYEDWFPWCTSEYTLRAIREMRARARSEGYETRVDYKGRGLAGDGTYQSFGKLFIRTPRERP